MSKLDVIQLDREIRQKNVRPFYVVVGEESYLAAGALKKIEAAVLGEKSADLCKTVLEGKGLKPGVLSDSMQSLSLFGGKHLVVVRNTEAAGKPDLEDFTSLFSKKSSSTTVIFTASKLDGRGRFMQAAAKSDDVGVVECKPLYPNQIPSWINMEFKRHGKQISSEAAGYLADIVGSDLGTIVQAIERLVLFVGARAMIELKDVEEAIAETTKRSIFELTDAVGSKNTKRAVTILKNLLDQNTQPVLILNMIARHFRILIRAKEVEGRGSSSSVAGYLGVNPYFVKNYLEQSKKFSAAELKEKFKALSRCDREIKSSRIPKDLILEKMILKT